MEKRGLGPSPKLPQPCEARRSAIETLELSTPRFTFPRKRTRHYERRRFTSGSKSTT
jgi:hypothetical protein